MVQWPWKELRRIEKSSSKRKAAIVKIAIIVLSSKEKNDDSSGVRVRKEGCTNARPLGYGVKEPQLAGNLAADWWSLRRLLCHRMSCLKQK